MDSDGTKQQEAKTSATTYDSMGYHDSCGFKKEIILKNGKTKYCKMKNFSRTNQTYKYTKALSVMAS